MATEKAINAVSDTKVSNTNKPRRVRQSAPNLHFLDLDERDRRGYQTHPQQIEEHLPWEQVAAWLEN